MKRSLEITISNRKKLFNFLEIYSVEQLNTIPPGFSNNMIWNIGHTVVVQQMLLYRLSGLPMIISDTMVAKYKRGTRPESLVSSDEITEMKTLVFSTIEQSEKDFITGIFTDFQPFTTMSDYYITDAESAVDFNNYHEGVHMGVILSLRKFI